MHTSPDLGVFVSVTNMTTPEHERFLDGFLDGRSTRLPPTAAASDGLPIRWSEVRILRAAGAANHLADEQFEGGWKFRVISNSPRALFTLYPLLALRRAWDAGSTRTTAGSGCRGEVVRFLDRELEQQRSSIRPFEAMLALRTIQLAQIGPKKPLTRRYKPHLDEITRRLTTPGWLDEHVETITDDQDPISHITLSVPTLYLAARNLWPKQHPVNLRLGALLRDSFDIEEAGSSEHAGRRGPAVLPRNSLGVLAARALTRDIETEWGSLSRSGKEARLISATAETRNTTEHLARHAQHPKHCSASMNRRPTLRGL